MKACTSCGKPLKQVSLPGGKRGWACKKPTCKQYMKAVK
jgi:hypothetical protein